MRALIILNGEIMLPSDRSSYDEVLCCDGAYNRVGDFKVDCVVGDMDSVRRTVSVEKQVFPACKDFTDGEAALRLAIQRGATEIDIVGLLGGDRTDQVLTNLFLLGIGADHGVTVCAYDRTCMLTAVKGKRFFDADGIQYFSMVPIFGQAHIKCTEGLLYPLSDYQLRSDTTIGVSNEPIAQRFAIDVDDGKIIAVLHYKSERSL